MQHNRHRWALSFYLFVFTACGENEYDTEDHNGLLSAYADQVDRVRDLDKPGQYSKRQTEEEAQNQRVGARVFNSSLKSDGQEKETGEASRPVNSLRLNLRDYQDNQFAFLKTRGSLDPNEDVVFYWTGSIFLDQPKDPFAPATRSFPGPLMYFEGFNIARFKPVPGGVRMLSREISVYKDLSGRIIDCWSNRPLGLERPERVPVVHVFNDPVNHTIRGGSASVFGDVVTWNVEVILRYPSPIPVDQYTQFSAGNTYESSELFNFFTRMSDLNDPALASAPVTLSWSRVGQLLPWMKGGQSQARLIYHTHGHKLLGGFEQLPEDIKAFVRERAPEYNQAPSIDESPNQTSWKVFKRIIDAGAYQPTCP